MFLLLTNSGLAMFTSLTYTTDLAENKRVVLDTALCNKGFGKFYHLYGSIHDIYVYVKQRLTKPREIKFVTHAGVEMGALSLKFLASSSYL
jgi:hypothetical protein